MCCSTDPVMVLSVVGGNSNVIEGANITIMISRTMATQSSTTVHLTTDTNTTSITGMLSTALGDITAS